MNLLEQMATFVRVVEAGSLSAAARQLRLSNAAVSRQLSTLKEELGGSLILRTTRKLTVTDVGRHYYERCVRILRDVDDAQGSVRTKGTVRGPLRVSAPAAFGLQLISPNIPRLMERYPELRIDLRLEDRPVDLVGDAVNVVIRAGALTSDSGSLVAHAIHTYRRVAVASPAYVKKHGEPKDPSALPSHRALVFAPGLGRPGAWRFVRDGEVVRVQVFGVLMSNSLYALRDAAVRGAGIALLPRPIVESELATGSLRVVLSAWEEPPVPMFAVHRVELRGAARLRVFLECLREACAASTSP